MQKTDVTSGYYRLKMLGMWAITAAPQPGASDLKLTGSFPYKLKMQIKENVSPLIDPFCISHEMDKSMDLSLHHPLGRGAELPFLFPSFLAHWTARYFPAQESRREIPAGARGKIL